MNLVRYLMESGFSDQGLKVLFKAAESISHPLSLDEKLEATADFPKTNNADRSGIDNDR